MPSPEPARYRIVRSRRRTIALTITAGATLVVRAPMRTPVEFLDRLVESRQDWIQRATERVERRRQAAIDAGVMPCERLSPARIAVLKAEARRVIPARVEDRQRDRGRLLKSWSVPGNS